MKVRNLGITTGNTYVIVMRYIDARPLGMKQGDRIAVTYKKKKVVAILDLTKNDSIIKKNEVGIFHEVQEKLGCKTGESVDVDFSPKPQSVYAINKKLHGAELSKAEIYQIVQDVVDKNLSDIEMTYFVSACFMNELTIKETVAFTNAMVETGKQLSFPGKIVADKHCIGGVAGNRTTCLVIPIIAAAGITIPKTSSRSITSPAGTADTMEVLCDVTLNLADMKKVIRKTSGCLVWGGSMDIAPSDDTLIKVEHPMSLDPIGQMLASVLAKKKAAGSTHVLIDIPAGKGSKVPSMKRAKLLKDRFELVGKKVGMKVKVAITDGTEPIGNGIGPALEARDLLWTLQGDHRGSMQLVEKAVKLAGMLLELCGKKNGEELAKEIVISGKAAKKFDQMLKAQGLRINNPDNIILGHLTYDVKATKSGKVVHVDNKKISQIARMAGAPSAKETGLYLNVHKKSVVKKGDVLYTIYASSKSKFADVKKFVTKEIGIEIKK